MKTSTMVQLWGMHHAQRVAMAMPVDRCIMNTRGQDQHPSRDDDRQLQHHAAMHGQKLRSRDATTAVT
ncbi:hypothetical protein ACFSQT_16125 [Mesorhizobium calcicola]|uniref:Uncharacterized protein n=1 Tax=Mesorhizobium calcicola TaxID=1300310 RepID=A0ABW4WGK2_9HYPH